MLDEKQFAGVVKNADYFLLDMDGTIYLGDKLIGDMPATLNALRQSGKKIIYLTNNSSKSKQRYYEKLSALGLLGDGDAVYTSGMATAEYIKDNFDGKSVFLLGTEALREEFLSYGVELTDGMADISVLSYDTELTYEKLCRFTENIKSGSKYVATHPDDNCPTADGFVPDAGAFMALVERSTGLLPELIIGKPYPYMGRNLTKKFSLPPEKFIMVGDRLNTDILFGNNSLFNTLFVLSGECTLEDLNRSKARPSFVLDSLNDIVKFL